MVSHRGRTVNTIMRVMMHCTLAAAAVAHGLKLVAEMYSPSIYNDPRLSARMQPTLRRVAGDQFIPNHSPKFHIDESSMLVGVRTLAHLTLDYMLGAQAAK
jgi:metal-dependent amidase/aminoacylase/carboxypeptidase family protein